MKVDRQDRISEDSCLVAQQAGYEYRDAYALPLRHRTQVGPEELVTALFECSPAWVHSLMKLRHKLVGWMGLKTASTEMPDLTPPFRVGQRLGLFVLHHIGEHEVVFGEDDKHLDFRISLLAKPHEDHALLTISNLVQTKNTLGRAYLCVVKPFHRVIVASMVRAMARRLDERGEVKVA